MVREWARQKRELDSYNTFFAAIKGEVTGEGLYDLGYRLVGCFQNISDSRNNVTASPDFVLFNGETLLLVEIKSGENITDRDIQQMVDCGGVSIEAAQNHLADTEIRSEGYDPNGLRHIQPCIVYYENFIEECKTYAECLDMLDELKEIAAVLTQDKGSSLERDGGTVVDDDLENALIEGIQLPKLPDKNIHLTEGAEKECLAFSICYDCVQNNMGKGRVTISTADVMEYYSNREILPQKISSVLHFLDEFGACREIEDGEYEFTTGHMRNIMRIEEQIDEKRVDEWLGEETQMQKSLSDY